MDSQRRLLLLADQVSRVDADLGSGTSQAWFTAAIDSLAHALVDLSDGRTRATRALAAPVAVYPTQRPTRDRASCAAARAELTAVGLAFGDLRTRLERPESGLVEHTAQCLQLLISALGEASTLREDDHSGSLAIAHRNLRAAFRVVQPATPPSHP